MRLESARPRRRLISLTPLIDVVFLLLVFFMLTASFLEPGTITLDSALPGSASEAAPAVTLRLSEDGQLYHEGRPASAAALAGMLGTSAPLRLESAEAAPLQSLIDAVEALEAAGFSRIAVAAEGPRP